MQTICRLSGLDILAGLTIMAIGVFVSETFVPSVEAAEADPQCSVGPDGKRKCPTHPAVVRICNTTRIDRSYGSGTLIEYAGEPYILTCAHLFSDGVGEIAVGFAGVSRSKAKLLGVDQAWDLALLTVQESSVTPVAIAEDYPEPGDEVRSCGWGDNELLYRCNIGRVVGYKSTSQNGSHETLVLTGYGRQGDSGGPAFNRQGELVAVCWGTDGQAVYGTFCGRIRRFLRGIIRPLVPVDRRPLVPVDRGTPAQVQPPAIATGPPPGNDPVDSLRNPLDRLRDRLEQPSPDNGIGDRLGRIEDSIEGFAASAISADAVRAIVGELVDSAPQSPGLASAAIPAILAGLGWTGPPAIAAVVGLKVLSVLIRRRRRKRVKERATESAQEFPPGEPIGSLSRDDEEGRQILQLSRLEGRSPLHDAIVGRIAFDELDKAIDAEPDGSKADWARTLRRTLEDRFNEMAPLAVHAGRTG